MDSIGLIVDVMGKAFSIHGLATPDIAAMHDVVGSSLDEAVMRLLPAEDKTMHQAVAEEYRRIYFDRSRDFQPPLFDGVRATLDTLRSRGYLLGIVTGKSARGLAHAMAFHQLEPYFRVWRSADQCPSKPHPAMVQECMAELCVTHARTSLVGDSHLDMQMAINSGVWAIGVSFGAQTSAVLRREGASIVVNQFAELVEHFPPSY
jgi:phosphoglycolate phosphatase